METGEGDSESWRPGMAKRRVSRVALLTLVVRNTRLNVTKCTYWTQEPGRTGTSCCLPMSCDLPMNIKLGTTGHRLMMIDTVFGN